MTCLHVPLTCEHAYIAVRVTNYSYENVSGCQSEKGEKEKTEKENIIYKAKTSLRTESQEQIVKKINNYTFPSHTKAI